MGAMEAKKLTKKQQKAEKFKAKKKQKVQEDAEDSGKVESELQLNPTLVVKHTEAVTVATPKITENSKSKPSKPKSDSKKRFIAFAGNYICN